MIQNGQLEKKIQGKKLLNTKLLFLVLLSFCTAPLLAVNKNLFPKKYKIGDISISIRKSGMINVKYKDSGILAIQNIWFMNEKWRALPRKNGYRLTVDILEQTDSAVILRLKDIGQDFLKNFEQQVKLTKDSLYVSVDYEYTEDIGQWHWPVYLFAEYYTGKKYTSTLTDGIVKKGIISDIIPEKIIYGLDNNRDIKELTFNLKDFDLKFTFMENGWHLCDHRGAPWMKKNVFMLLNSTSSKKKYIKEHYAIKVSIQPKKN